MLTSKDLFSIPYYDKGAVFTGSQREFRFRVERAAAEDGSKSLKVTFYPDRLCWELTPEEEKNEMTFEYSPSGLENAAQSINSYCHPGASEGKG